MLAGVFAGSVVIMGVEMISSMLYPLPAGLDTSDHAALASHIGTLPAGAFVLVLAGWLLGTLAAAWTAARIAQRKPMLHGAIMGGLFLVLGVANMLMLPHPAWVWVCGILIFVAAGYAGGRLAAARGTAH